MNLSISRRVLAVSAASIVLTFGAAACGGSDKAVCSDAIKAFQDYSSQAASSAGNLDNFNKANADLAAKLKDLSGKADGDLKTTLADLSTTWGSLKIDAKNPAAAADELTKLGTKATEATQKLGASCS